MWVVDAAVAVLQLHPAPYLSQHTTITTSRSLLALLQVVVSQLQWHMQEQSQTSAVWHVTWSPPSPTSQ